MLLGAASCQPGGPGIGGKATPVYDPKTGRLVELQADRTGTGRADVRAHMDGAQFKSVEIDRNGDGKPDRWEYYAPPTGSEAPAARNLLVRAEEANGPDARITRREFYDHGVIQRVEEDTDNDGRVDKWEEYEHGALARMDLDLKGRGTPDRRLIYRPDGSLDHMEVDPDGTGQFRPLDQKGTGDAAKPAIPPRKGGG